MNQSNNKDKKKTAPWKHSEKIPLLATLHLGDVPPTYAQYHKVIIKTTGAQRPETLPNFYKFLKGIMKGLRNPEKSLGVTLTGDEKRYLEEKTGWAARVFRESTNNNIS